MTDEKWVGYATDREGRVKRIPVTVPEGTHPAAVIGPLVPAGYRLQAYGPADD